MNDEQTPPVTPEEEAAMDAAIAAAAEQETLVSGNQAPIIAPPVQMPEVSDEVRDYVEARLALFRSELEQCGQIPPQPADE